MKIYVGWDSREDIAYQVCEHSIKRRDPSAEVIALKQNDMRAQGIYTREKDKLASTEFTFTRFFVPYLNDFKGWAVFCDCDFLWKIPSHMLTKYMDSSKAVVCVQHDYTPKETTKMDGQVQTVYPRKNWSSVVLWNCSHPSNEKITVDRVNNPNHDGAFFHRFSWLHDDEIGKLPCDWNWLVGWYKPEDGTPRAIHYTEGGPWFKNYRDCEYNEQWKSCLSEMMRG